MPKEYIARDAAIIGLAASSLTPHQIDDAAEALKLVPAADVEEVRHGQWIFQDDECMSWCTKAICGSCKQTVAFNADLAQDWGKKLFLKDNPRCAKCGAKMIGGQNNG